MDTAIAMNGARRNVKRKRDSRLELEVNVNDNNVVVHFPDNKTGDDGKQALFVRLRNVDKATDRDIYMVCNKSVDPPPHRWRRKSNI